MMRVKELKASKSPLETINLLFKYYATRWEGKPDNEVVDTFYGCFLVDVEAELKEKFPEVTPFIQRVKPPKRT